MAEYNGGTQKPDSRYGVGNSEKWGALGEEVGSGSQAACQLPRWDNSEKVTPTTQSEEYARDFRKALKFDLTEEKEKIWVDESSKVGQSKKKQGDELEITSPMKPNIAIQMSEDIGYLDVAQNKERKQKRKVSLKKMAREQSPAGDTVMKVQEYDVGSKRPNKEESLEIEEGRRQKKAREGPHTGNNVLTNEMAVAASQHRRAP